MKWMIVFAVSLESEWVSEWVSVTHDIEDVVCYLGRGDCALFGVCLQDL